MHNIPPEQAIKIVRRDRPGSVQTSAQAKFVHSFHEYINASKVVFALPYIHDRFTIAEMIEQQNRMVHGEKSSGARLALPKVLDFLCKEVEKAAEVHPAQVIHGFINHIPFHQIDGKSAVDFHSIQELHFKGICEGTFSETTANGTTGRASSFINVANTASGGSLSPTPPPPVPSFTLSGSTRQISQDELFPIKVALNLGESNWHEAGELCNTVMYYPALLLDWLEHLVEPLLEVELLDIVAAQDGDSNVVKAKALNKLPIYVVKSMDRLLSCLRVLQNKIGQNEGGVGTSCSSGVNGNALFNAVCTRAAMALFHISSSMKVSMAKHAEFIALLVRDWHAPKRLELNLESLQKLGKAPTARKLLHSGSKILENSPASPKAPKGTDHHVSLEPVVHPRPIPTDHLPKPKENSDTASPLKMEQLSPHLRLPPDQGSSPLKAEMTIPPQLPADSKKESDLGSVCLSTTSPSRSVLSREKESEMVSSASATSPTSTLSNSSSACSLPSVRGGDRYKNKLG